MSMESYPIFQEQEGEWRSQKTVEIAGLRVPKYFAPDPAALHDFINGFKTRKEDVMVVSFPKSGTVNSVRVLV